VRLKYLLKGLENKISPELPKMDITSIATDSRDAEKGSLFIAIEGSLRDGHSYVREAFMKGAQAVLVNKKVKTYGRNRYVLMTENTKRLLPRIADNFYGSPSQRLKLIGITGTNGKTTTSYLIESILESARIPCGVIGTIEYRFSGRKVPATNTTPDIITINELLSEMIKGGVHAAAMEVSSHALEQERIGETLFDAAVFTNVTHEHLDYHKSIERYFNSKMKIFAHLKKKGYAIINADDRRSERVKKGAGNRIISYGLAKSADIKVDIHDMTSEGSSFTVKMGKRGSFGVKTRLVGEHNISNILAATAACMSQNVSLTAIKRGIESVSCVRGRLEEVDLGQGFKIFIDYAHTHNALENVLRFLEKINKNRMITVFGCGGERDRLKRPLMGKVAQKFSDYSIITNDNSRSESPRRISKDIIEGMDRRKGNFSVIIDRKKAIEKAIKKAGPGDIVLIAGKGHETEQVIGRRNIKFDDRLVAEKILRQRL